MSIDSILDPLEGRSGTESPVDLDDFREWLDAGVDDDYCGTAQESDTCPLAQYLTLKRGRPTQVTLVGLLDPQDPAYLPFLPQWARFFVRKVDCYRDSVTYKEARGCLASALLDCKEADWRD